LIWQHLMVLERLDDSDNYREPEPFAGPDHPMRTLTRSVADGDGWTAETAEFVSSVFDRLAPEWSEKHVGSIKRAPIEDALVRGDLPLEGQWLELGSGTGAGARTLRGRVGSLVATDISMEMLAQAPGELAPRLRSDASSLPFTDDSFDAILMINMILFPDEVARVLRPTGSILWANTLGDQTPIHLPAEDVLAALPGNWTGNTARAGTGFWLTARRA
jgi:SAM-dependent methyltransferase